jgi:hypothetical protein
VNCGGRSPECQLPDADSQNAGPADTPAERRSPEHRVPFGFRDGADTAGAFPRISQIPRIGRLTSEWVGARGSEGSLAESWKYAEGHGWLRRGGAACGRARWLLISRIRLAPCPRPSGVSELFTREDDAGFERVDEMRCNYLPCKGMERIRECGSLLAIRRWHGPSPASSQMILNEWGDLVVRN